MSVLEEYRIKNPKRKIIFMNEKNEYYGKEYADFNFEIIKNVLSEHNVKTNDTADGIVLCGKSVKELLFECAVLGKGNADEDAVLVPLCGICDVMSACARIISHFQK